LLLSDEARRSGVGPLKLALRRSSQRHASAAHGARQRDGRSLMERQPL